MAVWAENPYQFAGNAALHVRGESGKQAQRIASDFPNLSKLPISWSADQTLPENHFLECWKYRMFGAADCSGSLVCVLI